MKGLLELRRDSFRLIKNEFEIVLTSRHSVLSILLTIKVTFCLFLLNKMFGRLLNKVNPAMLGANYNRWLVNYRPRIQKGQFAPIGHAMGWVFVVGLFIENKAHHARHNAAGGDHH